MAEIINLNKARKARDKSDRRAEAEENRVRFGRTRGEKATDRASTEGLHRHLDGHRRDQPVQDDDACPPAAPDAPESS